MYEAPIELFTMPNDMVMDMHRQMVEAEEKYILQSIEKVGVNVNKEELIKALAYDRGQYEKGYKAGVRDFVKKLEKKVQHYPYYLYGLVKAVPLEDIYEILMETVGENTFTKVEHNSLCETETFEGMVGKHEEV